MQVHTERCCEARQHFLLKWKSLFLSTSAGVSLEMFSLGANARQGCQTREKSQSRVLPHPLSPAFVWLCDEAARGADPAENSS